MIHAENSSNRESIGNIRKIGIPVIIFGAGIVGEALFHACLDSGIEVECFCDNNINKTRSSLCGLRVIHSSALKTRYKDAYFLISAADIRDVVDQLHGLGYSKWHSSILLLRDFKISKYKYSSPVDFVEFAIGASLLCHDRYLNTDKLFLRSVDIVITERCSLKCRDCSNLMQYYEKPANLGRKELMRSIDAFCNFIDEVHEFRIIGGEPFMHKEFHLVIDRLIDEQKVRKIAIYTNGTIVPGPGQIERLKDSKVLVFITDYGKLSKKLDLLTKTLLRNRVAFYIQKAPAWTDCAKIARHHRNIGQQKEIFKNCCAKNTATLLKGRFYRCPFSANASGLMAVPDLKDDYIDISYKQGMIQDVSGMKKRIAGFISEKKFLETCDYCSGRSFGDPEITPAIQTDKPLEYERHS